jgi:hypothetical protein
VSGELMRSGKRRENREKEAGCGGGGDCFNSTCHTAGKGQERGERGGSGLGRGQLGRHPNHVSAGRGARGRGALFKQGREAPSH